MSANDDQMTRGEMAQHCGVNVETLRYYEDRGLLPEPDRTGSNHRLYDQTAVRRVHFILKAKELGFTLKEIGELLSLRANPDGSSCEVRQLAASKIEDIESKVKALNAMLETLRSLASVCDGGAPISECPILDSLESDEIERGRIEELSNDNQTKS